MRKNYFLIVLAIIFTMNVMAQNLPSYVPKDGIVGWWPFNGNANDESGNGNHGTVNGATLSADRSGKANSAYSFRGSSQTSNSSGGTDFIKINTINPLNTNIYDGLTISGWFKLKDLNSISSIINISNDDTKENYGVVFDRNTNLLNASNGVDGSSTIIALHSQNPSQINSWYNFVFSIDYLSNTSKFYVNGILQEISSERPIRTLLSKINIGIWQSENGYWYANGEIDDIAIYNRALTEQEITALYSENNPCTSVPTIKSEGPTTFVEGDTLILKTNNGAGNTFQWQKDGVAIVGANDSIYKVTTNGNYTVTVTEQAGLCKETSKGVLVTVTPKITPTIPSYVSTNGLVGYWPFNGNANDESGNGNHGTPINVSYASDRFGNLNSASNFPNGNTNSEIIIGEKINPKKFTISVWVRATGQRNDGFHSIISRINQYNTPELPPNNFELQVSCPDQTYTVWTGFGGNNVWQPAAPGLGFGNNSSELNKWNHLILTFDGLEGKTYTNGKLFISQNIVNYNNETSVLSFGDRHNGPSYEFNWWGDLDDIAIYNRALSQQEITALYTSTPPCASTTAAITTSDSTTFCQGGSAILTAAVTSASTPIYQWYNNDQAIPNATQNTYKATTAGKYTVKVVDGACEAVSLPKDVTVNPLPTATISPSGNVSKICEGSTLTLVADGGVSYKWNTGATENKITVSKKGPYYADVINQFGCKSVVWRDVVVEALPTVTINNLKQIAFKNDSAIQLEGTPKGGVFTGEGVSGNTFIPEKSALGKKAITYTYSTTNGCKGEAKGTILLVDSLGNVCSSTKYDTVIVPKTVTKYDTVKVNTYDTITVTNNVTKYDTVIVPKTVTKYDTIKVNKYDTITVTNNVTKYDTIIVKTNVFDTVKVNTYDTITLTNTVTKYDTITVTDTVNILKINFKLTTGIKANQMTSMSIYPNPTSDVLIIDASDLAAITGYSYRILDVLGKEVYNALVSTAKTEISLKTLGAKGMYVLHILDANKLSVQTKQIVLE